MVIIISAIISVGCLLLILISCNSIDRNGKKMIKQNDTLIKLKMHELKIKPKVKKVVEKKVDNLSKTDVANLAKIGITS